MSNEKKWMFSVRITSNKPVSEMESYKLALNNCYAKDGNAMYRDYDGEHDIRSLIAKISETIGIHLNTNDPESLDWLIHSWLEEDETDGRCGIIAMLYALMWSKAELYERLKKYEDAEERGEIGCVPRWIPVTERLPGPDEMVLAYCPCRKGTPSEIQTMRGWEAMIHASHWQLLPELPEVK